MCERVMESSNLAGKTIVLGICGGIAAYKAAFLASLLTKRGCNVYTVMTEGATQFITPLTLQSLTHCPVYTDVFDERDAAKIAHIDLADSADLVIIAPATADFIARAAQGMADDMLTAILLATRAPVVLAPAMNVHMLEHPLVRRNVERLQEIGYTVAEPGIGALACGYTGRGRLMEPEDLVEFITMTLTPKCLQDKHVLITAGPTRERLDPVRFLSNDSTGAMGYALAQAAWRMGAQVTLITGVPDRTPPLGVETVAVESAQDMLEAVMQRMGDCDLLIKAAAVADYRPQSVADRKIKKQEATLILELTKNPDILLEVQGLSTHRAKVIGFAAETHDGDRYAREKLIAKRLAMLVLNNVLEPGAGFGEGTNKVTLYFPDGRVQELPLAPKLTIATAIVEQAAKLLC